MAEAPLPIAPHRVALTCPPRPSAAMPEAVSARWCDAPRGSNWRVTRERLCEHRRLRAGSGSCTPVVPQPRSRRHARPPMGANSNCSTCTRHSFPGCFVEHSRLLHSVTVARPYKPPIHKDEFSESAQRHGISPGFQHIGMARQTLRHRPCDSPDALRRAGPDSPPACQEGAAHRCGADQEQTYGDNP